VDENTRKNQPVPKPIPHKEILKVGEGASAVPPNAEILDNED